jgi:hypothetical protein
MSDWCSNTVKVVAKKEQDMDEFLNVIKEVSEEGESTFNFSLGAYVKEPQHKKSENWYSWRESNWGTTEIDKDSICINRFGTDCQISFETKWTPCESWIKNVGQKYSHLSFQLKYHEMSSFCAGKIEIENGVVKAEESYDESHPEYVDFILEGNTESEIEMMAREKIENEVFAYWDFSINELVRYVGEEYREQIENEILVKKLTNEIEGAVFDGSQIEDIVDKLIGKEKFYDNIIEEHKKEDKLKELAV